VNRDWSLNPYEPKQDIRQQHVAMPPPQPLLVAFSNRAALVDIFDLQRAPVTWFDDLSLAGVEWADKLEGILAPLARPGNVLFNFPKMYSNGARSCEVAVTVQL
jgi:hypothetical protein